MCAKKFLAELATGKHKGVPKSVKVIAHSIIRHFPWNTDLIDLSEKCPEIIQFPHSY